MSENANSAESPTASPFEASRADLLDRLLDRLEHIDRVASRLERLADEAPPLMATAVDALDDSCRRLAESTGAGADERLGRVLRLLERLTDNDTSRALDALLDRIDRIEPLLERLDQLPGLLAVLVDALDESAGRLARQGIDVEVSLRQGVHALLWLGQRIREPELERLGILLRSDVLEPHALAVVGKTGRALAACHEGACDGATLEQVGPIGLLRALGDPDVRRSLAFAVQVGKRFGQSLSAPDAPGDGR
ncbi:DUF1641 domain-containing protein [Tautonia sociabilis]|nr:DUF1641 domain-containing protein [Tautonia sociabilis]